MKEKVHHYPQRFFSVARFLEMVQHDFAKDTHDPAACILSMEDSYYRTVLVYRLLREDVLVFDQDMYFEETECNYVASDPESDFYLFKYVYEASRPLRIEHQQTSFCITEGFLGICNNFGSHKLWVPAGFEGKMLQILIERSFLEEFVHLDSFRKTPLEDVLFNKSGEMLTIDFLPQFLKRRLDKLVSLLHLPTNRPFDKLNMLAAVAGLLENFFGLYLHEKQQEEEGSPLEINAILSRIAGYLKQNLHLPFPGMDYLAKYFGISISTLKRHFVTQYKVTPHGYFRNLQMEEAKRLLERTTIPITEIGYKMGFDSPGNFTRVFKKVHERCPTSYRRNRD